MSPSRSGSRQLGFPEPRSASPLGSSFIQTLQEQLGWPSAALSSGKELQISEKNWRRRWLVEGAGSGWRLELSA